MLLSFRDSCVMLGQLKQTARALQYTNITSSALWLAITPSCSWLQQVTVTANLYDLSTAALACCKDMFQVVTGVEQHLACMSLISEWRQMQASW